jgi:hypothetical protein
MMKDHLLNRHRSEQLGSLDEDLLAESDSCAGAFLMAARSLA